MTVEGQSLRSWLTAITTISRDVNDAAPLDVVLNNIARQGCTLIGFDSCGILLNDMSRDAMEIAGSAGLLPGYLDLVRHEQSLHLSPLHTVDDLPVTRAYHEGRTITVSDVRAANYQRLGPFSQAQGYQSILAAPLRDSDQVVGVLIGYCTDTHEFEPAEVELAELLAEQTATAIQAARLRASEQATINELSIANAELRQRRARLDWAEQQHRRLMQLVLDDIGLDGLVATLADLLDASVTVQDAAAKPLSHAFHQTYLPPPRMERRTREPADVPHRYEAIRVAGEPFPTWYTPIIVGGELVGRLWVVSTSEAPDAGELHLIERFALVVGLEIVKQRHLVEVQERLSADLLVDLLRSEGVVQPRALVQRAAALGHDLTAPHWLAVSTSEVALSLGTVVKSIRAGADIGHVLAGVYDNSLVLLISSGHDPLQLLRRLQRRVEEHRRDSTVTFALSPLIHGINDYAVNYRVALRSVRLRNTNGRSSLIDLRDLPLTTLLLTMGPIPSQLAAFAENLVRPLSEHDARRGGDLVATLRTWLNSAFSVSKAAAELTLHVNTVNYRLSRAQQLLGRDLRLPDTRLELQLALHVWDIITADMVPTDDIGDTPPPPA